MNRAVIISLVLGTSLFAHAKRDCPILLLDGTATRDGITVTVRNKGKFAIPRMEFNCVTPSAKQPPMHCVENSPMLFPGTDYSATFSFDGKPREVRLSVKRLEMSNGTVWKPQRPDSCQTLVIRPPRVKAGNKRARPR